MKKIAIAVVVSALLSGCALPPIETTDDIDLCTRIGSQPQDAERGINEFVKRYEQGSNSISVDQCKAQIRVGKQGSGASFDALAGGLAGFSAVASQQANQSRINQAKADQAMRDSLAEQRQAQQQATLNQINNNLSSINHSLRGY